MIIFDEELSIVAIDDETISLFGYNDLESLKNCHKNIADRFVKKDGYIYNFEHYSWIDFLAYSDEPVNKVIIEQDIDKQIEAEIELKELHPTMDINGSDILYIVSFKNIKPIKIESNKNSDQDKPHLKNTIDTQLQQSTKQETKKEFIDSSNEKIDKKYDEIEEELDINRELYDELLKDFAKESEKAINLIKSYIEKDDYDKMKKILNRYKSIFLNLRLDIFSPSLYKNFNELKDYIENIKNFEKEQAQKLLEKFLIKIKSL